jgi:hypothetical protein
MLVRLRRLALLVFALFLIAQVAGVTASVLVEAEHEYATDHADDGSGVAATGIATHHHHHTRGGVHDTHDQCCALHHGLIGTLPHAPVSAAIADREIMRAAPSIVLAGLTPLAIDRPPRTASLI